MDMDDSHTPSAGRPSSPLAPRSTLGVNSFMSPPRRKERRNPSITPRRFARFFGPTTMGHSSQSAEYQARGSEDGRSVLNNLALSSLNRESTPTKRKLFGEELPSLSSPILPELEPLRKRSRMDMGFPFSDENMPALGHRIVGSSSSVLDDGLPSSPSLAPSIVLSQYELDSQRPKTLSGYWRCSRNGVRRDGLDKSFRPSSNMDNMEVDEVLEEEPAVRPIPIKRYREYDLHNRLLAREIGYSTRSGRTALQYPSPDPHPDVAAYCSQENDLVQCTAFNQGYSLIPFSVATTTTASGATTVVGDEEGYVRFITRQEEGVAATCFWQAHANAIMDLDWSPGGTHLATAAGDRNARVLDIMAQSPLVNLTDGHDSCLRQVKFQPGNGAGHILATSDRSSRIQIWDTRYKRPCTTIPEEVFVAPDGTVMLEVTSTNFADPVNTLWAAHSRTRQSTPASVTSLQWLSPKQNHLLLSGSEADATVKLWDTRYIGYTRDHKPKPLAYTAQPPDHVRRPYGVTSLALNTDASRLYSVCKNGTVYAYSTSHLILGHGPELANLEPPRPRNGRQAQGLGPLYGFRHERLKVNSFFIKCAVLPSNVMGSEILAVGSSDGCPVLFPTDERAMQIEWQRQADLSRDAEPQHNVPPSFQASDMASPPSSQVSNAESDNSIPIYSKGTPLVEGTALEVSSVKWLDDGTLVSISDDYSIRFWRQDAEQARFLRTCGYFGGHRHNSGWADVENADELDDEDDPY